MKPEEFIQTAKEKVLEKLQDDDKDVYQALKNAKWKLTDALLNWTFYIDDELPKVDIKSAMIFRNQLKKAVKRVIPKMSKRTSLAEKISFALYRIYMEYWSGKMSYDKLKENVSQFLSILPFMAVMQKAIAGQLSEEELQQYINEALKEGEFEDDGSSMGGEVQTEDIGGSDSSGNG